MTKLVNPRALAAPHGFSHGAVSPAGVLCVAGQIGCDREGRLIGERFTEQFDQALANVLAVVAGAGGAPESVLKLTIFVTDKEEYARERRAIGARYRARMGRHFPAMTLIEVKGLLESGARVEIEALAYVPAEPRMTVLGHG